MLTLLGLLAAAAFEIVQLDEGVYAARVQPMPPMYVFANALIVVDDEAVTVVDTHQSSAAGSTLEQTLSAVTLSDFRAWFPNADDAVKAAVERAFREATGELSP